MTKWVIHDEIWKRWYTPELTHVLSFMIHFVNFFANLFHSLCIFFTSLSFWPIIWFSHSYFYPKIKQIRCCCCHLFVCRTNRIHSICICYRRRKRQQHEHNSIQPSCACVSGNLMHIHECIVASTYCIFSISNAIHTNVAKIVRNLGAKHMNGFCYICIWYLFFLLQFILELNESSLFS